MNKKKEARLKRAHRTRMHIRELNMPRLSVFRSPRHIYAQIVSAVGAEVQVGASSLEAPLRKSNRGNIGDATKVGKLIAKKAKKLGIERVAFDRSGYRYHGRVKALAEAAREGGLDF